MIPSRDTRWVLVGLLMSQVIIVLIGLIMGMTRASPDPPSKPVTFQPLEPLTPFYDDQRDA